MTINTNQSEEVPEFLLCYMRLERVLKMIEFATLLDLLVNSMNLKGAYG